jgi:cytochrome oxidase assembly protein ShyY1
VLKVVLSRRWLTALVVATLFSVACVLLGQWQWRRHEEKAARAQRIETHYSATPVSLSSAIPRPGVRLAPAKEWTLVTVTGRYAARQLMLVRNRPNNGVFGYEVVVPLELADGASLLIDRGWIPNGRSATEASRVPATPPGQVTVTGWLRPGEPSRERAMPRGQLASINLAEARAQAVTPQYGAYLIRRSETGARGQQVQGPQPLERPDTGLGPHLAYALQWWLAAPVGFALVFVGARREHLDGLVVHARPRKVKKTRIWDEEDG